MFAALVCVMLGQCPDGVCPPATTRYEWRDDMPGQVSLYRDGVQIGAASKGSGVYRPLVDWARGHWGEPCEPPVSPPSPPAFTDGPLANGVDAEKLAGDSRYRKGGDPITRETAVSLVEKGLPNDRGKYRLTVIGSPEECAKVAGDLAKPEQADVRDRVILSSFRPDNFLVARAGFVTSGHPTVYLQAPEPDPNAKSAKVLYREDDYHGPMDFGAIRKAIADYDARRDPGRKPAPDNSPGQPGGGVVVTILAAALAFLAGAQKKE